MSPAHAACCGDRGQKTHPAGAARRWNQRLGLLGAIHDLLAVRHPTSRTRRALCALRGSSQTVLRNELRPHDERDLTYGDPTRQGNQLPASRTYCSLHQALNLGQPQRIVHPGPGITTVSVALRTSNVQVALMVRTSMRHRPHVVENEVFYRCRLLADPAASTVPFVNRDSLYWPPGLLRPLLPRPNSLQAIAPGINAPPRCPLPFAGDRRLDR